MQRQSATFSRQLGVPQDLDELSADLLLAYRGALAMRAERGHASRSARNPASAGAARFARLWGRANRAPTTFLGMVR